MGRGRSEACSTPVEPLLFASASDTVRVFFGPDWKILKIKRFLSPKQLQRYVNEFACRYDIRELDTAVQMAFVARRLMGRRLPYAELIANNGSSDETAGA